ncbi:MAG: hypothetical protein QF760_00135 [Candidatus Thalassarchaeaceae archaeon]|nr:hypothetical protein [Candidatus Thalassarchaeaceae archaeon]
MYALRYVMRAVCFAIAMVVTMLFSQVSFSEQLSSGFHKVNEIGDAPDSLWGQTELDYTYQVIFVGFEINGNFSDNDSVDVFALKVSSENGARVGIMTNSTASFQILLLNQTNWVIEGSKSAKLTSFDDEEYFYGEMNLSAGHHAVRIERIGSGDESIDYSFKLVDLGPVVPNEDSLEDLSRLFSDFYLFAGFVMLLPLLIVLWWNRGEGFGRRSGVLKIEDHEKRRLRRLRERLGEVASTNERDKAVIESALRQLSDSAWEAVVSDWGQPQIRHLTQQIEICAWRIPGVGGTLLVGIRIGSESWELAAIRIHSPEGSEARIGGVSPEHLFHGDEIFLDKLTPQSNTFLRVSIIGEPSVIGFNLSGVVGGVPVAAVPMSSIRWEEE